MTGVAIRAFRGEVPRTSARLIADNQAQTARNCKITSGRLDPLKGLGLVHTSLLPAIVTMYRYRFREEYNWLVWSRVVDVVRSPIAQDSLGRFYYTGDGEPRMSTYADAITGGLYPAASFVLGVVAPILQAAITVTGGVGVNEDRAYVYTFVTKYFEESGPSPATLKTGKVDGSWDISGMSVAPPNSGTVSAAVANTPLPGQVELTLNTVLGLAAYEELTFAGVAGMTDLNGTFKLVSVNSLTSKVVVALTTAQTYTVAADTWTRVAPHNTTGMTKRIYRTVGTNANYKLVAEIPVANATYSDTISAAFVSLTMEIQTLDTLPPLKNLHSLVLLANNALAGISDNQICFSEQGKPHSWPVGNRYSFPGTGVALCAAGNSAIILTDGFPYVATATIPEAASVTKIPGETLAPCIAKLGMVDIGSGAIYPSHDGLYVVTTSGAMNLTKALYTYDAWQTLMPSTFKAAFHDSSYYAMHATSGNGLIFVLHTKEPDSIIQVEEEVDSMYANPWDGRLYVGQANTISQWDADDNNRYVARWYSREYQLGQPVNLSAAQVHARFEDVLPINNAQLNANIALLMNIDNLGGDIAGSEVGVYEIAGSALLPVPDQVNGSVNFTLVRNGVDVFFKQVTNNLPFRLPAGIKSDVYAAKISASIPVHSINMAQGMAELKQAPV